MVKEGFSVRESLDVLVEEEKNKKFHKTLISLKNILKTGVPLSKAISDYPLFPPLLKNIIKAGEETDKLPALLEKYTHFLGIHRNLKEKMQKALIYPIIIFISVVIFFLYIFPFSYFIDLFQNLHMILPFPTKLTTGMGKFIGNPSTIPSLILTAMLIKMLTGKYINKLYRNVEFIIPILGPLNKKIALSRFCRILAILLNGKIPLKEALSIAEKNSGTETGKAKTDKDKNGLSLKTSLFLPPMVIEVITEREKIDNLPEVLYKISDDYNREVEFRLDDLKRKAERIIIAGMFIIVAFTIVSIFMARYPPGYIY